LTGPLLEPLGPTQPVATIEDFDTMVGDLRRTFRSWLKKVESELRRERETLETEKKQFEEERQRIRTALVTERQTETAKLQVRPGNLLNQGCFYITKHQCIFMRVK